MSDFKVKITGQEHLKIAQLIKRVDDTWVHLNFLYDAFYPSTGITPARAGTTVLVFLGWV